MIIRSLEGEDKINHVLNNAMWATLDALLMAGMLTDKDQVHEFANTHIAMLCSEASFWTKLRRWLGASPKGDYVVIVKIASYNKGAFNASKSVPEV